MSDLLDRISALSPSDDLFADVAWDPVPVAPPTDAAFAPPASVIGKRLDERYQWLASMHELSAYEVLLPALDALVANFVRVALRELGFDDTPGRRFTARTEAVALDVVPEQRKLFARLLAILTPFGDLSLEDNEYVVNRQIVVEPMIPAIASLPETFVADSPELALLIRCGPALGKVLNGSQDPIALIFPGGEVAESRHLYEDSPAARVSNGLLAGALGEIVAACPAGRVLRILEIGGGTGSTTSSLLDVVRPTHTEYTFTDLSPIWIEHAAARFADRPFVRPAILDIEQDPADQGFAHGTFDVVVAANSLHAARDLPGAVRNARSLLAPGGILLLLEGTACEPWLDVTIGMTESWWRFSDSVRHQHPLISRSEWIDLLWRSGFEDPHVVQDPSVQGRAEQQSVFIARTRPPEHVPVRPNRMWTVVIGDSSGAAATIANSLVPMLTSRGDTVVVRPSSDTNHEIAGSLVYLAALDATNALDTAMLSTVRALSWIRRQVSSLATEHVWLVTSGAQTVCAREGDTGHWQSPLWAIGRAFSAANPTRLGGLVDLDPAATDADSAWQLIGSLEATDEERQTAWRDGTRYTARVNAVIAPSAPFVTEESPARSFA